MVELTVSKNTFIALLLLGLVWAVNRSSNSGAKPDVEQTANWVPPKSADKYMHWIIDAETTRGIPPNLLARVAYQESRFRPDIIDGRTVSSAGALGIMQIVPRWHPNVDPLNPKEAIYYAADYLRKLKARFGSWPQALAAYNWGQGNLEKYLRGELKDVPRETQNYVAEIGRDIFGYPV